MKYLFVILIIFSFLDAKINRDSQKEVVIDDVAKLMWLDNISVIKTLKNHENAAKYCKEITHLGFNNWRLPKVEEYELIVDKTNTKTYINRAFKYNVLDGYWAAKAHWRTLWYYADYMHFISGTPYYDNRIKKKYVRCVRDY